MRGLLEGLRISGHGGEGGDAGGDGEEEVRNRAYRPWNGSRDGSGYV